MRDLVSGTERRSHYVGGRWVEARGDGIDISEAATGGPLGTAPRATQAEVDAAVDAAARALPAWSATPPADRARFLLAIRAGIEARLDELAATWSAEVGMPFSVARAATAGLPLAALSGYATVLEDYPFERASGSTLLVRQPIGVGAAITPWNYPLSQMAIKTGAALAAGCTVVGKPSEVAPLCAYLFAEIVDGVGLPPGVFNLVAGDGPVTGEALAGHRSVGVVSFTGSTATGARILQLAAPRIARVSLELGGKSPSIVLDREILPTAMAATMASCHRNAGQTCTSLTRLVVPRALAAQATDLAVAAAAAEVVGDPFDPATTLGPLVSDRQRQRVREYIRRGVAEGARLAHGGVEPPAGLDRGFYVRPTVFTDVAPTMTIAREEIFGPVLSILTVEDEDDAVAVANAVELGLAASVWATDRDRALRVARRIDAGSITVNGGAFNPQAPYGGLKQSGLGHELGVTGIEEWLDLKVLHC